LWQVAQMISPAGPTATFFSRITSASRPFVTFSNTGCASEMPLLSRIVFWLSWQSRQK